MRIKMSPYPYMQIMIKSLIAKKPNRCPDQRVHWFACCELLYQSEVCATKDTSIDSFKVVVIKVSVTVLYVRFGACKGFLV